MFLLIDGQAIQSPTSGPRGIGRYSRNLVRAIAKARPDWRIELVQNGRVEPLDPADWDGLTIVTYMPPMGQRHDLPLLVDEIAANELHYADWLTAQGADAVLLTSTIGCETTSVVPRFGLHRPAVYAVIYDMIPLLFSERYLPEKWQLDYYAQRIRQQLEMDALFAISQASADDFSDNFPDAHAKVVNIRGAIDPDHQPLPEEELQPIVKQLRAKFNLKSEYILYVGGPDWRKNVDGAIKAYASLVNKSHTECHFVVAGTLVAELQQQHAALAEELGVGDRVHFTGYVSENELKALYQDCRVFFFPSLYEGLGLPVLEALHFGVPVVASNNSSLPEFAGDVCWLADPSSPKELGKALRAALAEPYEQRQAEREAFARTFRWEETAEAVCATMAVPRAVEIPQPRIAWVTSVASASYGVYDVELFRELGNRCNLVVAVDEPLRIPEPLATHARIVSWSEFPALANKLNFDQIVFDAADDSVRHTFQAMMAHQKGLLLLDHRSIDLLDLNNETIRNNLNRATGIVVPSKEESSRLRRVLDVPVVHIPMALGEPKPISLSHMRLKLCKSLGRTLVGMRVADVDIEQVEMLFRAVAMLPDKFKYHFELVIFDSTTPAHTFRMHMASQSAGILPVHFLPGVERSVAMDHIASCDLWVMTNPSAIQRTATLRAMALGVACLTPGAGPTDSPERIMAQKQFPSWQLPELAGQLRLHAEQPHLRKAQAQKGLAFIQQRHRLGHCSDLWAGLLDRAVKCRIQADTHWRESVVTALQQIHPAFEYDDLESWAELRLQARRHRPAIVPRTTVASPTRSHDLPIPALTLHRDRNHFDVPKRIWVDVGYIATAHVGRFTGICRTVVSVLKEMIGRPELPLHFCIYQQEPNPHFRPIDRDQIENLLLNGSWVNGDENVRGKADDEEVEFRPDDMLFLPELNVLPSYCQLLRDLKAVLDLRIVPVVYDLIPCREPHLFGPHSMPGFWNWAVCLIESADTILAISEHTKRDLYWLADVNRLPEPNVEVFRLGDSDLYQTVEDNHLTTLGGLTKNDPFVLMVSTIEVRKNHQLTYRLWRRLIEKHGGANVPKLIYVGSPGWLTENFADLIRSDPLTRNHIIWMSNLGDDGLGWLYQNCLFTVYPSMYEGWGLPIGESLSFGKYCIASKSSSMPGDWRAIGRLPRPQRSYGVRATCRTCNLRRSLPKEPRASDSSRVSTDHLGRVRGTNHRGLGREFWLLRFPSRGSLARVRR